MEDDQKAQEDAEMAQLGKILRARPDLRYDPATLSRYTKYASSRGLPAAIRVDEQGRQYVDPDSIPNSGGIMDLTPQEKAYALTLPKAQRLIEFPGQSPGFYDQQVVVGAPERSKIMDEFSKNVTKAASGVLSPEGFAAYLSAPDVRSVLGDGPANDMVRNLNDPAWVQANLAPAAAAKIGLLNATKLSTAAKTNLLRLELTLKPQQLAAQIAHANEMVGIGQERNALTAQGLQMRAAQNTVADALRQQQINNQAIKDNGMLDKAAADTRLANAQADKALSLAGSGNPAMAQAQARVLANQMTGINAEMKSIQIRMDSIAKETKPTPQELAQLDPATPGTLMARYVQLSNDLGDLQTKNAALYEQLSGAANTQASSMSGKAVTGLGSSLLDLPPGVFVTGPGQVNPYDGKTYIPLSNGKYFTP